MSQRLMQIVRSACSLQFTVYFISGQEVPGGVRRARHSGQVHVDGCRITHFFGTTEEQHASKMDAPSNGAAAPRSPATLSTISGDTVSSGPLTGIA